MLKNKNNMIIPKEKVVYKIQHPFVIKMSGKMYIERTLLNTMKVICTILTHSQNCTKWKKFRNISPKAGNYTRLTTFTIESFSQIHQIKNQINKSDKENKRKKSMN